MDEHMLIEFLVNRIQGMDRLYEEAVTAYALAAERREPDSRLIDYMKRAAERDGQCLAYRDVLTFLVTFECQHVTECRCAVGGLR